MQKKKVLIFHPVLATYRIDQFNSLNELVDLTVVFLFNTMWNYNIDQNKLLSQCNFTVFFLLKGPRYQGRIFRFGMYRMIQKIKPDIILGYEYSFTTQYLILLKRLRFIRQKIGSFIDDSLDICHHVQSKARQVIRQQSIKRLDFLVVMSDEVSRFHQVNFKLNEQQIIMSQSYVQKFGLREKKVLLFVGRFIPEKALPLFLDTISPILTEKNDILFVLVGKGAEHESLRTLVKEKQLEDKVIFPGKYEGEELYAWYTCASGFVLPSLSETFGAVVNEALIFGLKVFCSQFAGASCLINLTNGMIFNPLDRDDTVEKMDLFLEGLTAVDVVCLANTPPLIEDHQQNFSKEWRKLTND